MSSDQEVPLAAFLQVDRMYPLCFNGASLFSVGSCPPHGTCPLTVTLFPVQTGVHSLNGIELRDLRSEKTYPFNSLCIVFVEH